MGEDSEQALQAALLRNFHEALMDLMASNDVKIEYFAVPSGAVAFCIDITPVREILGPLARPLGQSIDDLIHSFRAEHANQHSLETH